MPAPDHAPLLEHLTTLRRENAALRAQNGVLQGRIREPEARLDQPLPADMYAPARMLAA